MTVLSIIIPNFNSGELLDVTLKSIFKCSLNFKFEVLIIDNLSTDCSLNVVKSYSYENVTIVSERDDGIYDAMNKGITLANGNWFIFLGAGDEFLVQNVNRIQFEYLEAKVIYGDVFLLQEKRIYDGEFSLFKLMKKNICHQAIFYHKSIFKEFGNFDTKYKIASDYVFNLSLFFKIKKETKYLPVTVSNFMGLGVSDKVRDDLFQDNKVFIINKIVFKNLSLSNIFSLVKYNIYILKRFIKYRIG